MDLEDNSSYSFEKDLDELQKVDSVTWIAVPIVFGPLLLIGVFGNLFVIYVTLTTKRNPVHSMLVLNLAVSDMVYLLAALPQEVLSFTLTYWIGGPILCPLLHFLRTQTMATGIFSICSLALIRFLAVRWPFWVEKSFLTTSGRMSGCVLVSIVWIFGSMLALPIAIYYNTSCVTFLSSENQTIEHCQCVWIIKDENILHKFNTILLILTYIVPFVLVSSSYCFIARIVNTLGRNRTRSITQNNNNNGSLIEIREQSEYARTNAMMFGLVIAFTICWFPHHFYEMSRISGLLSPSREMILNAIELCFSYAHACLNPVIYTFASPDLRQTLCLSLKCHYFKERIQNKFNRLLTRLHLRNGMYTSSRFSQDTLRVTILTNQEPCSNIMHDSQSHNRLSSQNSAF